MSKQTLKSPDIFAERRVALAELAQLAQDDQDQAYIAEQKAELERAEAMQAEADRQWRQAQQAGRTSLKSTAEVISPADTQEVSRESIGWLSDASVEIPLERKLSPNGKPFRYGRITELNKRTRVNKQVFPEPVLSEIEETLVRHLGSKIDAPDHRSRDLRPLEPSATRGHTLLNPYKDDNISINHDDGIRVLVLEDGANKNEPTYYMAAVCKHDEQQQLIYGL